MMFNKLFKFTQTKLKFLYENSLLLKNLDKLIFLSILVVFLASTCLSSDVIGFVALVTTFLTLVQLFTKFNKKELYYDKITQIEDYSQANNFQLYISLIFFTYYTKDKMKCHTYGIFRRI